MRDLNRIIVHHSITANSDLGQWQTIKTDHMENRGWRDIGYHYGVGTLQDTWHAIIGRPIEQVGAHCKGHNKDSIGVCILGDYDNFWLPEDGYDFTTRFLTSLCQNNDIPSAQIYPHSAFSEKTCCGVRINMDRIGTDVAIAILREGLGR